MPVSELYVLDADVFIAAHRSYYAFDIAPGFWNSLLTRASAGTICSIEQVLADIMRGHNPKNPDEQDALQEWATDKFKSFFVKTDEKIVTDAYSKVINWAYKSKKYSEEKLKEFAGVADSWLIAYAYAHEAVLVTNENKIHATHKVPIPAVCRQFDVEYINTYEMLRRLKIILS